MFNSFRLTKKVNIHIGKLFPLITPNSYNLMAYLNLYSIE